MVNEQGEIIYGDENTGYNILARNMSPEDARRYLDSNVNDGILNVIPERKMALEKRAQYPFSGERFRRGCGRRGGSEDPDTA